MTVLRWPLAGIILVGALAVGAGAAPTLLAQSTTRLPDSSDAVVALVAEIRALRADLAAASRNQLRAQLLLGRVQMQEQRLAYLDKQRADVAAQIMAQSMMGSALRNQFGG